MEQQIGLVGKIFSDGRLWVASDTVNNLRDCTVNSEIFFFFFLLNMLKAITENVHRRCPELCCTGLWRYSIEQFFTMSSCQNAFIEHDQDIDGSIVGFEANKYN